MAKALLLAWVSPSGEETDAELNSWYENTHIPQVRAAIPWVTSVHRYRTADLPTGQQPAHRYLAVYEMDSDDVPAAAAALAQAGAAGRLTMTTAMDVTSAPPALHWYQGIG
jgi:hypothetical protein